MGRYNFSTDKYIEGLKNHDEKYFAHVINFLDRHACKNSYILDIGTGTGNLIKILREKGYVNSFGLDLDSRAVSFGRNELGLYDTIFDIENFPFRKKMFDVVISFTVGEHINNISDFIDFKNSFLKETGIFYMYMPNYHSPMFYLKNFIMKLKGDEVHKTPFTSGNSLAVFFRFIKFCFMSLYKILTGEVCIIKVTPLPSSVSEGGDADATWCSSYLDLKNSFARKKYLRFEEIEPPSTIKSISRDFFAARIKFGNPSKKNPEGKPAITFGKICLEENMRCFMKNFIKKILILLKPILLFLFEIEASISRRWSSSVHKRLYWATWKIPQHPEFFDHHIDLYYQWLKNRSSWWLERGVFGSIAIKKDGNLLELACGDGFNTRNFYSAIAKKLIACDYDKNAIYLARQKNSALNIDFILADIRNNMPIGSFDNIVWDAAIDYFTPDEIKSIMLNIKERLRERNGILSGNAPAKKNDVKNSERHECEFEDMADLKRFLTPYFKNVIVFETVFPERRNLYFWASDGVIPFTNDWKHWLKNNEI